MMDMFTEVLLKRKKHFKEYLIIVPLVIVGVIGTLAYYIFLSGGLLAGVGLAAVVFMWWGIYLIYSKNNLEFEYTVTNGDVDIDMIIAKRKRKRLISFNAKSIQLMAPVEQLISERFDKEIDASAHDERFDVYFIDVQTREGRVKILVNPSEKMLNILKTFRPQNIVIGEEK